jgi:hypothetical protein
MVIGWFEKFHHGYSGSVFAVAEYRLFVCHSLIKRRTRRRIAAPEKAPSLTGVSIAALAHTVNRPITVSEA